ncbi:methionyl-tRNA formyltransferase [Propylenella binzhouense]|uniref:Methionyl-tRNA formyltransferase n=1 Tax=Propylenella binzhouense TaxID=2555902 RepID=A0A964T7Z9_9HYPH|nr:methionyl-tRNA formyltransferase [Propylenella binzhouense]MYZ49032.1 methionyl-tRNA formyltransferase [Propylenella binzhouense]
MRIVFMGTPALAVPTLVELVGQGHEIAAAYTQPPRPAGRGMAERPSPVQETAEKFGIPVRAPKSLRGGEEQESFRSLAADVAVVVAYGLILPPPILEAPRHGCLNLHGSLLPRWRGAAPIQRAIMAGDAETGVMVMRMDEGLDTGPVCMAERVAIGPAETAGELGGRLARLGADLMVRAVAALERGALACLPQSETGVVYAAKIDKAEARIDWSRPAAEVARHINGLSPFPGAWCEIAIGGKPERVKVLRAVPAGAGSGAGLTVPCGTGAVDLLELQRAGRKAVTADEFLRGARHDVTVAP